MTTSKPKVVILGSGAHAKVVIEILELRDEFEIVGCLSGDPNAPATVLSYEVLGDWGRMSEMLGAGVEHAAIGVGGWTENGRRKEVFENAKEAGFRLVCAVHPSAVLSESATVGEACCIYMGALIQNEVSLGSNTVIATGAQVDHETTIENHVLVSAGVNVGGQVTVGEGTLLAIGSTVVSNVRIGRNALVAAGAVVVDDVPDNARMFGVPAVKRDA